MRIREARSEDAVVLAELGATIQQLHHDERPDWFKPANADEAVKFYEELLENADVTAFVAEDDAGVLGFVLVNVLHRPETPFAWAQTIVHIDQIGVAPSARHRGVGRELFQAVRALADQVAATRVFLTTWDFNTVAHRFFEAEGLESEMRRMSMPWPAP